MAKRTSFNQWETPADREYCQSSDAGEICSVDSGADRPGTQRCARCLSPVARQQRILMTHGTGDPLVPIANVRPQIPLLKASGINVEWREFAKDHTIAGEQELSLIRNFVRAGYGNGLVD